ncbi:uncharacterized protein LOC100572547 [Acyrthosiphon pisum]|uniref:DUF4773 domain-containing protein n=1 Tax=Acyrthosiphon pisum TaxID=7029 RepID=A0A8R2FBM4_ACYPI|nr:uncharacterized protein LOC100572547 [Acyrthosiphon pisum]|eukprot:XP_008185276.2 PREDICTED: uncharacterized protein LOC100572547 isoform X1 [Acyrthosiphon pisum]
MDILRDFVVFALLLSYIVVKHSYTYTHTWNSRVTGTYHKWYDIYYDAITNKKIPMLQRFGDRQDEPRTARFGSIPCSCQDLTCGCCAQFNVRFFDYNKKGCMNFTYDPYDFAITGNMFMDDESMYEYKVSAKNPPPACLRVPVPYLPSMDMCMKMFDIYTPGRNLHACVNFVTRIEHAEVLVLEFDCFVIGRDGLNMHKYNTTSSTTATATADDETTTSTTTTMSSATTTVQTYDTTAPDLDITVAEVIAH